MAGWGRGLAVVPLAALLLAPGIDALLQLNVGHQHVLGEGLSVERVGAAVEQVPGDDRPVHHCARGKHHWVGHEGVHQRILELIGRICAFIFSLLVGNCAEHI